MKEWAPLSLCFPDLDNEHLFSALRRIDAPPDLMGLFHVAGHAPNFLQTAQDFAEINHKANLNKEEEKPFRYKFSADFERDQLIFKNLTDALKQIKATSPESLTQYFPLIFFSPSDINPNGLGRKTLRPHTETHPLFCALWYGCASSLFRKKHEILSAFALFTLNQPHFIDKQSKRADLGRCLRKLGELASAGLLDSVPEKPCSVAEMFNEIQAGITNHSKLGRSTDEPLQFFTRRALEAWGLFNGELKKRTPAKPKGGDGQGGGKMIGQPNRGELTDESLPPDEFKFEHDIRIQEILQSKETQIPGDARHEFGVETQTISITPITPTANTKRIDVIRMRRSAKGLHNALARQRQNLPFSLNQATPTEIKRLLQALQSRDLDDPAQCLLWLIIISGRTFEEIYRVQFATTTGAAAKLKAAQLSKAGHDWFLTVPTHSTQSDKLLTPEQKRNYFPVIDRLSLPLPTKLGDAIQSLRGGPDNNICFTQHRDTLQDRIQAILSSIHRPGAYRWTLQRIEALLFHRLIQMPGGDPSLASIITGQQREVYLVQLAYTALPESFLLQRYREALHSLLTSDGAQPFWPASALTTLSHATSELQSENTIGSRLKPFMTPLKQCILDLQKITQEGLKSYRLQDLHNAYAVYTLLILGLATGARPTSGAFARDTDLDLEQGWCLLSDKDSDDFAHTRIVYLPKVLCAHMRNFLEYRKRLLTRLASHNPAVFAELNRNPRKGATARKTKNNATRSNAVSACPIEQIQSLPLIFFLNHEHSIIEVSPQSYQDKLEYFLNIRPNSNRHLLRSVLLENGMGQTALAAFMGHHRYGEAPWSNYSSMNPQQFRKNIELHLAPILEELSIREMACPIL
ncbi:hypothetical protein [Chitinibacter sp. ZOR0017]|uniref:hypothetical protein n=1 Tax=Chitinibacter sp. ZOR0017 TaxID=1339254 RepID=UPI00064726BE|nr:hypothetical protein [Chitinibacter sp. ZOR0017]